MKAWMAIIVGCLTLLGARSEVVSACGDKFVVVGRGVRFEQAYAAIHPGSILIVLPMKNVKSAAVRDSRLVTALKMAGHRVEVVQQPANVANALARSRRDIILVEQADAAVLADIAMPAGQPKPSVVAVLEDPSASALTEARRQLEYVLATPAPIGRILNLMDDVMKARLDSAHRTPAGS
jgi:vacuolar-type H+-ATPase subunit F/Vma7